MRMYPQLAGILTDNETLTNLAANISLSAIGSEKMIQLLTEASHPKEEVTYRFMTFAGNKVDRKWFSPLLTPMGKCYTFRGTWLSTDAGQSQGLSILSVIDYDNYFFSRRDYGAMGIKIFCMDIFLFFQKFTFLLRIMHHICLLSLYTINFGLQKTHFLLLENHV